MPLKGGSSMLGDGRALGEMDKVDPVSETRDGAASTESAREISDVDGDSIEMSLLRRLDLISEDTERG